MERIPFDRALRGHIDLFEDLKGAPGHDCETAAPGKRLPSSRPACRSQTSPRPWHAQFRTSFRAWHSCAAVRVGIAAHRNVTSPILRIHLVPDELVSLAAQGTPAAPMTRETSMAGNRPTPDNRKEQAGQAVASAFPGLSRLQPTDRRGQRGGHSQGKGRLSPRVPLEDKDGGGLGGSKSARAEC